MERLSGLDASFVYNETASLHMHTLKYTVLDVRGVDGGFTVVDAFSRIVRLGEGLSRSGALSAEAMDRAVGAL